MSVCVSCNAMATPGPKAIVATLVGLGAVVAVVWYVRRDGERAGADVQAAAVASGSNVGSATSSPTKIRKLTPTQRAELAIQFERARASRVAAGSSEVPATTDRPSTAPGVTPRTAALTKFAHQALAALAETQEFLRECYDTHKTLPSEYLTLKAKVTVTADPELGALIDAASLEDSEHRPLPAELDACLRDMLQTLVLPPLPENKLEMSFQLSFKRDEPE